MGPSYLFCGELCVAMAAVIRYRRRVEADGRIYEPDVSMGLEVREGHVLWGEVYRRTVTPAMRREVFAVKGTACLVCGAAATEIDHIRSHRYGDDSVENLQPLCHLCHLTKTLALSEPREVPSSEEIADYQSREAEYQRRWRAPTPLSSCDDEHAWPTTWRLLRAERRQAAGVVPPARARKSHRVVPSDAERQLMADRHQRGLCTVCGVALVASTTKGGARRMRCHDCRRLGRRQPLRRVATATS